MVLVENAPLALKPWADAAGGPGGPWPTQKFLENIFIPLLFCAGVESPIGFIRGFFVSWPSKRGTCSSKPAQDPTFTALPPYCSMVDATWPPRCATARLPLLPLGPRHPLWSGRRCPAISAPSPNSHCSVRWELKKKQAWARPHCCGPLPPPYSLFLYVTV
jgi:hypothetical protein